MEEESELATQVILDGKKYSLLYDLRTLRKADKVTGETVAKLVFRIGNPSPELTVRQLRALVLGLLIPSHPRMTLLEAGNLLQRHPRRVIDAICRTLGLSGIVLDFKF